MVSIIMPTYNRAHIIKRAIVSVLKQTYQDYELIIVDDGSTDNTREVVDDYRSEKIRYYRFEKNQGANRARNYGMQVASGEYFAFLDSDNEWLPTFLAGRMEIFRNYEIDFTFGRYFVNGNKNQVIPNIKVEEIDNPNLLIQKLLKTNVIDTNTVCMKRICWENEGGFDDNIERMQDWDYFLSILSTQKYTYHYCIEADVNYYTTTDSISNNIPSIVVAPKLIKKRMQWYRKYNMVDEMVFPILRFATNENDLEEKITQGIRALLPLLTSDELCRFILFDKNISQLHYREIINKNECILKLQQRWINMLQKDNNKLELMLLSRGYKSIAIYGYGILGKSLNISLANSEVNVKYVLDKFCKDVGVTNDFNNLCGIDAIIVTAIANFDEIVEELGKEMLIPIVSLEDVLPCEL